MVAALLRCVFCAFSRQTPLLQLAGINRNFEVISATDFLAAITQHIPDKGAQMVRYYGWYQ